MEKVTKSYVEKIYRGLLFSEPSTEEVTERDPMKVKNDVNDNIRMYKKYNIKMYKNIHSYIIINICQPDEMGVKGNDIIDDANSMFDYINRFTIDYVELEHIKRLERTNGQKILKK